MVTTVTSLTLLPIQPQRPRAVKVHDENMPPPAVIMNGVAPGKTLHQRTKSTPSFGSLLQAGAVKAANKKILGEVNANIRVIRDDSEVGKASPGKIVMLEPAKPPPAAFARPAARPLAPKSSSSQATVQITTQGPAEPELVKKVVAKKSTKVLKEAPAAPPVELKKAISTAPVHQTLVAPKPAAPAPVKPLPSATAVQHQEVRKTESVPLRDEPVTRAPPKHTNVGSHMVPPGFASQQDYISFVAAQNAAQMHFQHPPMHTVNGHPQYPHMDPLPAEQFYDIDEDEYYCEDGYTTARSFGLRGESTGGVTTILAPKETEKVQKELVEARMFVDSTRTAEDIEDEQWDTSMSMRAVLMDWVIQVHQRFNLLPETLFLTVNYIDRFLSCKIVSLGKLQLVGATAIFVAAKYEEVQCPTIAEIIYMVDGGYNADELLKAERFMLSMLQFELGWPGPMSFLRRISKADDYDLETRTLAKYFLEVTVMDERFVGCTPSFLAAGAHCMARMMLRKGDWSPAHVFYSNYTYSQLKQLLATVLECCEEPQKHHSAVFDKYMDKRYKRASTFVAAEIQKGFELPGVTRGSSLGPLDCTGGRLW
ncbi:B-type cyclin [Teratosphaeriaceae sp. CCFEE 6253]|nr:B-type cyclin [Teratosphaeriaceae sp. CCFEE 6253]